MKIQYSVYALLAAAVMALSGAHVFAMGSTPKAETPAETGAINAGAPTGANQPGSLNATESMSVEGAAEIEGAEADVEADVDADADADVAAQDEAPAEPAPADAGVSGEASSSITTP